MGKNKHHFFLGLNKHRFRCEARIYALTREGLEGIEELLQAQGFKRVRGGVFKNDPVGWADKFLNDCYVFKIDEEFTELRAGVRAVLKRVLPLKETLGVLQNGKKVKLVVWCEHFQCAPDGGVKLDKKSLGRLAEVGGSIFINTFFCLQTEGGKECCVYIYD